MRATGLEERRERRRAKKAIVAPKPPPSESDSGENAEPKRGEHTEKASKKSKKGKGLNMPAGLALMHGFSATNIGKNRLTVSDDVSLMSITLITETRSSSTLLLACSTKERRPRRL